MVPYIQYLIFAILGYMVLSLVFHAFIASEVKKVREDGRAYHHKLQELHRKLDELGWATKQGMRQARQANAEHEWEMHTGITAI